MLSYATEKNEPWDGIPNLFVDSGGYSMMKDGTGHPPAEEYLDHLREVGPSLFALQDYPCEPDLLDDLDETVQSHQDKTTAAHRELVDAYCPGDPVAVVQGWDTSDYLRHLDDLADHGLLTDRLGVGSIVRRNAETEIRDVLTAVADATPSRVKLHGFGVKVSVLSHPTAREVLRSADTLSYSYRERYDREWHTGPGFRRVAYHYLDMKREVDILQSDDQAQTTLSEVSP